MQEVELLPLGDGNDDCQSSVVADDDDEKDEDCKTDVDESRIGGAKKTKCKVKHCITS